MAALWIFAVLAVLELCKARVLRLTGSETDCTVRQEGTVPENLTI